MWQRRTGAGIGVAPVVAGVVVAALLLVGALAGVFGPFHRGGGEPGAVVGPAEAGGHQRAASDGPTCTTVLTDLANLDSTLSSATPGDVICVRGSKGSRAGAASSGATRRLRIWLTGFSWQDNTPPGSAKVSKPVLHRQAGGQGTFDDPITVAVPGKGGGIWKAGARFYLPTVQRYVIVEDTGASAAPSGQDGHLDMWIGGKGGTRSATDACMDKITATGVPAELNPPPDRPVIKGPIYADGRCNIPDGLRDGRRGAASRSR